MSKKKIQIVIDRSTADELVELRLTKRESYGEIIERLIQEVQHSEEFPS